MMSKFQDTGNEVHLKIQLQRVQQLWLGMKVKVNLP